MKTTLDLPDDLVQRIKIRAMQERKPLKRFVAELLLMGLEAPVVSPPVGSALPQGISLNERGFPVIQSGSKAPAPALNLQQALNLEKQTLNEEDLRRAGLSAHF